MGDSFIGFDQAMFLGVPVVAVNSGGPTETVIHQLTGFLCDSVMMEISLFASEMHYKMCC